MTANLYQGQGNYVSVVGENPHGRLPKRVAAMKKGSDGPVLSEMQHMQQEEKRQHEQAYIYEHGKHTDDNLPLGKPSF